MRLIKNYFLYEFRCNFEFLMRARLGTESKLFSGDWRLFHSTKQVYSLRTFKAFHHPFSLKVSVHALILLLHQLHSDKYFFRHSDECHRGSKYRLSLLHQHINKLTSALFALLRSADQNGFCAGNVTVLELRSATRELITTPTATAAVAESHVVGRRQAVSTVAPPLYTLQGPPQTSSILLAQNVTFESKEMMVIDEECRVHVNVL